MTFKEGIEQTKVNLGITRYINCTESENIAFRNLIRQNKALPPNVYLVKGTNNISTACFFKVLEPPEKDIDDYLKYSQFKMIRTIKNCAVYFTTLSIISLIGTIILLLSTANAIG